MHNGNDVSSREGISTASRPLLANGRKYVTRACDLCKRKKVKCNGEDPCEKCIAAATQCTYETAYHRGAKRQKTTRDDQTSVGEGNPAANWSTAQDLSLPSGVERCQSTSLSGDTSARGFLRRVYEHLSAAGHAMPRYLSQPTECVLPDDNGNPLIVLPDQSTTMSYLDCFAEHAQVTYRYVPRQQWNSLVSRLYADDDSLLSDHASMALLLFVIGLGCIWYPSWKNKDFSIYRSKAARFYRAAKAHLNQVAADFPPTITTLQALTLDCQLLLTMNHFDTAWISLGTAIRTSQVVGLQKEQSNSAQIDWAEETKRRACFWALFMLDRYLSTALGRPMMINENDITILLPGESNSQLQGLEPQEVKLMAGMVAHIKLVKVIGRILSRLYPAISADTEWSEDNVQEFEGSLQQWLTETPSFFHPIQDGATPDQDAETFFDIPWSFKRQQRTIRVTYHFVNMLMYRGSLLREFLRTDANTPGEAPPPYSVQKCVRAAVHMASFAADIADDTTYNGVFWTTSYFTFCAISILLVYLTLYRNVDDRAQLEALLERAMRGHKRLDQSVDLETQRLLEESQRLAIHTGQVDIDNGLTNQQNRTAISAATDELPPQIDRSEHMNDLLDLGAFPNTDLDMILNVGFDCSIPDILEFGATRQSHW